MPMCRSAVWTIFNSVVRQRGEVAQAATSRQYAAAEASRGILIERRVDRADLDHNGHRHGVADQHCLLLGVERSQHRPEVAGAARSGQHGGDVALVIELAAEA